MSFWQMAYKYGGAAINDLKQAVQLRLISADEYKTITGEDYADA